MKRLILLFVLVGFIVGCQNTGIQEESSPAHDNEDGRMESDDSDSEDLKQRALVQIQSFKKTISSMMGVDETVGQGSQLTFLNNHNLALNTKDDLRPFYMNDGMDTEWLDMSEYILDFSEAVLETDYDLGEEVKGSYFSEKVKSLWGWGGVEDSDTIIISYNDNDKLYLRVIESELVETFTFQYNDEGLIEILRLRESNHTELELYIEDFIENTGLSMWSTKRNYDKFSTYEAPDGGLYTMRSSEGNIDFEVANYEIEGVPIVIRKDGDDVTATYDLSYMDFYDGFGKDGSLYKDGEVIEMDSEVHADERGDKYTLYVSKNLENLSDSLTISELGLDKETTREDILQYIEDGQENYSMDQFHYDYGLKDYKLIPVLEEDLFFDWSSY